MTKERFFEEYVVTTQAEVDGCARDGDDGLTRWVEWGEYCGKAVKIVYYTTEEDDRLVEDCGGDWVPIDWWDRISQIHYVDDAGNEIEIVEFSEPKTFRVSWERSDLTATIQAESADEVYGIDGEWDFDQGGRGRMPLPSTVEEI